MRTGVSEGRCALDSKAFKAIQGYWLFQDYVILQKMKAYGEPRSKKGKYWTWWIIQIGEIIKSCDKLGLGKFWPTRKTLLIPNGQAPWWSIQYVGFPLDAFQYSWRPILESVRWNQPFYYAIELMRMKDKTDLRHLAEFCKEAKKGFLSIASINSIGVRQ